MCVKILLILLKITDFFNKKKILFANDLFKLNFLVKTDFLKFLYENSNERFILNVKIKKELTEMQFKFTFFFQLKKKIK